MATKKQSVGVEVLLLRDCVFGAAGGVMFNAKAAPGKLQAVGLRSSIGSLVAA